MIRYRLSEPGRKDLVEIRDFISKENRLAARKVLTQLRAACRMLARHPGIGHLRTDLASEPLRFWPVRSDCVFCLTNGAISLTLGEP